MSFGRAQYGPNAMNPVVFWQEQASTSDSQRAKNKKFSYKDRHQKYSLRNEKRPALVKQNGEKNTKTANSKHLEIVKPVGAHRVDVAPTRQTKTKTTAKADKRNKPDGGGMVTLTKEQLDNLLETVAELTLDKGEKDDIHHDLGVDLADADHQSLLTDNIPAIKPYHVVHRAESSPDSGIDAQVFDDNKTRVSLNPSDIPGLGAATKPSAVLGKKEEGGTEQVSTTYRTNLNTTAAWQHDNKNQGARKTGESARPTTPPRILTKAEKKRLQWEKERAEQGEDYSPWGRPGAGAPVKDDQGNILADFNSRRGDKTNSDAKSRSTNNNNTQRKTRSDVDGAGGGGAGVLIGLKSAWTKPAATTNNTNQDFLIRRSLDGNVDTSRSIASVAPLPASGEDHGKIEQGDRTAESVTSAGALQQAAVHKAQLQREQYQPAAIRSSFAIGAIAPDEEKFGAVKERKRQEWLKDLAQQKAEKELEKQKAKQLELSGGLHDQWADRLTYGRPEVHGRAPSQQHQIQPANTDNSAQQATNTAQTNQPSTTTDVPALMLSPRTTNTQHQQLDSSQTSTFLRGANMFVDPKTLQEMDEKRKREIEHQNAIRAQVEEKERAKREEKERQMREDAAAEEKMKQDRDKLQQEYEFEQQKQKQKQLQELERVQKLKEAFDKAQEEAERLKHEQRLKRLQKGGHDTARLNHQFQASHGGGSGPDEGQSRVGGVGGGEASVSSLPSSYHDNSSAMLMRRGGEHVVEPTYVPGLHPTPREHLASHTPTYTQPSANQDRHSGGDQYVDHSNAATSYTENRVLTPSSYRIQQPLSPRREYGTQTDPNLINSLIKQPKSQNQKHRQLENRSAGSLMKQEKRVRVMSAPECEKPKRPLRINERPRWGAGSKSPKKVLKQSEKDPYYEKRRKAIELQREKRQQELLEESERFSSHVPRGKSKYVGSVSSKQRSRSQEARSRAVRALHDPNVEPVSILRQRNRSASPLSSPSQPYDHTSPHPHSSASPYSTRGGYVVSPVGSQTRDIYAGDVVMAVPPSPPVPTLRHARGLSSRNSQYSTAGDSASVGLPPGDGDYVPFIRSDNVLDPSHADDPIPPSREATNVERGRKAYIRGQEPASYGSHMHNHVDPMTALETSKNPLLNPSLVTDHPTPRQGKILQQLSDLRKGLIQKQKELEIGLLVAEAE